MIAIITTMCITTNGERATICATKTLFAHFEQHSLFMPIGRFAVMDYMPERFSCREAPICVQPLGSHSLRLKLRLQRHHSKVPIT